MSGKGTTERVNSGANTSANVASGPYQPMVYSYSTHARTSAQHTRPERVGQTALHQWQAFAADDIAQGAILSRPGQVVGVWGV